VKTRAAVQVTEVATGFNKPWGLAFLPDGRMLVTEKAAGTIRIVTAAGAKGEPLAGAPATDNRNQGGMMGIGVSPSFARDRLIYFTYAEPRDGGNGLAMARAKLSSDDKRLENVQVIFRAQPTLNSTLHYGGRFLFQPDGTIMLGLGERSVLPGRVQARDLNSHFGKFVRINADGSVPRDNPFVGRAGAKPEIWTSGQRNPLGIAYDAQGRLWQVEMGPRGGDELNLVERGKDYGWPTIGYGEEYSGAPIHQTAQAAGMEQPRYYWDPVISPGGMTLVRGGEWDGNLLIAGLSSKAIVRVVLNGDRVVGEERLLTERGERIRDVVQGPDGAIYALTDDSGKLLRVTTQNR
jgi:glucose/arabinose dehydrogenase